MTVWITGQFRIAQPEGAVWDIQGVFDSEEKAIKECLNDSYFVGPMVMNESLPQDMIEWDGCYYPLEDK